MAKLFYEIRKHILLLIFLGCYLSFSLVTYKAYPIGNGEEYRYLRGKETLEHLLYGQFTERMIQPLPNYFLYNLYPMILVFLNPKFFYEWFHLMNLMFSTFGFIAVYILALEVTKSIKAALFSLIALVLFPGFFGQLAFNPVDMPFMVFYLFLIVTILKYSGKDSNHRSTIVIGVLLGITQGIRQIGLTIYVVMVILDIFDFYVSRNNIRGLITYFLKNRLIRYIYIFIIANFFMLITWPNFAINFFKSYYWYIFVGSNFYLWDFGLLFFGRFLENADRPWYYLPFLQLITYPFYISTLFLGTAALIKSKINNRAYFIIAITILINYALYIIMHPVIYDGIRHFLFLIPLITILAIGNLHTIFNTIKSKTLKLIILLGISINLIVIGFYSVKEFPYQYIYFNKLAYTFGDPYKLFESDYSNTKYREASEWIRDMYLKQEPKYDNSDPNTMLRVYPCDNAYAVDYFSHKKFLTIIKKDEADLILCDFRNLKQSGYTGTPVKEFYVNNNDILYLFSNIDSQR